MLKKVLKKWKVILGVIVGIAAVFFDVFLDLKFTYFLPIISHVYETIIVVAGLWVTLYLLFLEIYKDRYPFDFIEKKYLCVLKSNFINIALCAVYGLFVIAHSGYLIENIYFIFISVVIVLQIGYHVYNTSKNMMVTNYVQQYCDVISSKFKENKCEIDNDILDDLNRVFEECIIKEEFSVAQKVSQCTGEVFREFMKKAVEFAECGEKREQIEKSFAKIAEFGAEQLQKSIEIESSILRDDICIQQYKNIKFCIESNQLEFYKIYIDVFNELTCVSERRKNDELVKVLFDLYTLVLKRLIKEEKGDWCEYLLSKIYEITETNSYFFTNDYVKYFVSLITCGLIRGKLGNTYEFMFELLNKITFKMTLINNGFSSLIIFYTLLFYDIKDNKSEYLNKYVDNIIGEEGIPCNDAKWIEFKFHCLNELDDCDEKINKYRLQLLAQVIEMKEQYNGYFSFPDFKKEIYSSLYVKERLDKVCEEFLFLFNRAIISDNLDLFFIILKRLDECLKEATSNQKDIQIALFEVYIEIIVRTRRINNKKFQDMTFASILEVLTNIDVERKISKGFGENIIIKLQNVACHSDSTSNEGILSIIELLDSFVDDKKMFCFCNEFDIKKNIAKAIYNIGITCIENDYEEGIRRASNSLGWMTIAAIKQGTTKLVAYILNLATKMMDISRKLNVSKKTETFLTTLFTTVGMFCFKSPQYSGYRKLIFKAIKQEPKEIIEAAIEMRTYENDMWDSLLENKTKECADNFKKELNKN